MKATRKLILYFHKSYYHWIYGSTRVRDTTNSNTANEAYMLSTANKDHLVAIERLLETRITANELAMRTALEQLDQRLHAMNQFREALTDQTNRMMTRVEAFSAIETVAKKTDAEVESIRSRIESDSRPNYPLMIGIFSTVLTLLAGMWMLVGLKIEATIIPNQLSLVAVQEHQRQNDIRIAAIDRISNDSMQADLVSRSDRGQLNTRLTDLENQVATGRTEQRSSAESTKQKLVEIETQFCASDIVRNLMHANDMRVQAMLWAKILPEMQIPTNNAYYPKVCNRMSE